MTDLDTCEVVPQSDCASSMFKADRKWVTGFTGIVICPFCGFECCHLESVADGRAGRGSNVTVSFWCESGHRFSLFFQFHKGTVYTVVRQNPDMQEGVPTAEMWRD